MYDNYLEAVKFSKLSLDFVQNLLERFIQNTQPQNMRFNPKVVEYSDNIVTFKLQRQHAQMSLSVNLMFKNLNHNPDTIGKEIFRNINQSDFIEIKVNKITYLDTDIIKIAHFTIIIRVESITRLIPGGLKKFIEYENVYGATNGKLLIMSEMRNNPDVIYRLYTDVLSPKGFKAGKDFVSGYIGLYETRNYWKPLEWSVVPWIDSIITPNGVYVKHIKTEL